LLAGITEAGHRAELCDGEHHRRARAADILDLPIEQVVDPPLVGLGGPYRSALRPQRHAVALRHFRKRRVRADDSVKPRAAAAHSGEADGRIAEPPSE
jgi:hypothetical protein